MAEVVLFHHAQGLTPGVAAFADELRRAGHTVHAPDLYDGRTFATLEEGLAYAEEIGFDEVTERGVQAAEALPAELVYAGFSLGWGRRRGWRRPVPGPGARYYSTLACRYRSSVRRGRRGSRADPRDGVRPRVRQRVGPPCRSGSSRGGRGRRVVPLPRRPAPICG